jgi:hypothetical protein
VLARLTEARNLSALESAHNHEHRITDTERAQKLA